MKTTLCLLGVVVLLTAAITTTLHAQTNAPRITAAGRINGVFALGWTNTGTNDVTVERRTSLTSGSWTAIASNNATGAHIDTNTPSGAAFYRVVMVSPPPNMALIPAGSFEMGDAFSEGDYFELPVHTVNVSAFYIDKYEVTKGLWDEVWNWAATNGYDINAASASGKAANHPAHDVTWYQAVKWCNARSEKEGLTPCYTTGGATYKTGSSDSVLCDFSTSGYRLPTEAEWEKAARGGSSGKRFPWGDTITHSQANYWSSSIYSYDVSPTRGYHPTYYTPGTLYTPGTPFSSPVGSFAPNAYGLYDMAGNMCEWCWDWKDDQYYGRSPSSDPRGPSWGSYRVIRDGGWVTTAYYTRAAFRESGTPGITGYYVGFRSARSYVP